MRRTDAQSAAVPIKISYFNGRVVSEAMLRPNDAGAQGRAQRLGCAALAVGKQSGVPLPALRPGDRLRLFHPPAAPFQIHAHWPLEIRQSDLSIAAAIQSDPPGAGFLLFSPHLLYHEWAAVS